MTLPPPTRPAAYWHSAWLAAILLTPCLPGAEPNPAPAFEAPKEYILFGGADVLTEYEGKPCRVISASRGSLEIKTGTTTEVVSRNRLNGFSTVRGKKLGAFKAKIDSLRATSLTVALNVENAQLEFDSSAALNNQERGLQEAKESLRVGQMALGASAPKVDERQQQIMETSVQIEKTRDLLNDYLEKQRDKSEDNAESPAQRAPVPALPFAYERNPDGDGLQIKCAISSPRPLEKAYLAVTIQFLDPREPGRKRMQTILQQLDRITEKPQKVTASLRKLPRGFLLVGCQLDLYGNGQEVATNVTKSLPTMTEEQVYQYFLGEYLLSNHDKTRPSMPLVLAPAGELRAQADPAGLDQVIYARIDERGQVVSLSTDETEVREVSPQILAVMRFVRFFPGLDNGKPVDSRLKLKPSELLR